MLDGFGSAFGQVALLLVAMVVGVGLGRYVWPRHPHRQDASSAVAVPDRPVPGRPNATVAADSPARAADAEAGALVAELEARLNESQSLLTETRRQLGQADAEVARMRLQVRDLEDRKEAEMGRLESGAIAALESAIASHREQVAKLEEKLRAAEHSAAEHIQELDVERRRSARLQTALAERHEHIAALVSERERQERSGAPDRSVGR
jgi:chromosome segregation ATPase